MRRPRARFALPLVLIALTPVLAACGGGDDDENQAPNQAPATTTPTTTTPAPPAAPSEETAPPGAGQLPPELVECFAEKGIDVEDIHSAPPEVAQECFSSFHGSGAAP